MHLSHVYLIDMSMIETSIASFYHFLKEQPTRSFTMLVNMQQEVCSRIFKEYMDYLNHVYLIDMSIMETSIASVLHVLKEQTTPSFVTLVNMQQEACSKNT